MNKVRVLMAASVIAAMSVLAGPAPAANATCSDEDPRCTVWESPICNERVPKTIRVASGCFSNQP